MHRRIALSLLLLPTAIHAQKTVNWPVYHGSTDNTHYTTLKQITPANVKQLQVAWTYETKDEFNGSEMQANPIVIDGVLYATSPKVRVFALDAETGKELWSFDPNEGAASRGRFRHRGVVVHEGRLFFTHRSRLFALDRKTGKLIPSFGENGRIDLRQGLGRNVEGLTVSASTPGVIYQDMLILGSTVSEGLPGAPGDIRAFDVKTGAQRWTFHTIPHPGEFGHDTWPAEAYRINGGANAWSGLTLDTRAGIVFAATGSASFDFYGANRHGDNLFANTVLALDARTGKRIWHFQGIRHDLWDLDFPAPPALVTVTRNGRRIDALAQITKTGHVFVLDRRTGASLFPLDTIRVPASTLDGEKASAIQVLPKMPPAFARQRLTEDQLTTRTPEAHAKALEIFKSYSSNGLFDPPSEKGIIVFPGYDGGGEWGGPAFDPETGLLYVNSNEMAWLLRMVPRSDRSLYNNNCASCHGEDRRGAQGKAPSLIDIGQRRTRDDLVGLIRQGIGTMQGFANTLDTSSTNDLVTYLLTGRNATETAASNPNFTKYRNNGYNIFLDQDGFPATSPPWGTLNAIDLNKGEIRWTIPFGEYPDLVAKGLTNTGTDNYGGPVVTQNGLLFIGASTYDKKFRAYDKLTGKLLWEAALPASGNATPSTYVTNGRQYIVIAAGGGKNGAQSGGTFVAFALPRN